MRYPPARMIGFLSDLAQDWRFGAVQVEREVCGLDERLLVVNRVGHVLNNGQKIAVTHDVLDHRRPIAVRHTISFQDVLLEMRRGDGERVTVPLAGGETRP